jgi:hypothetical protein
VLLVLVQRRCHKVTSAKQQHTLRVQVNRDDSIHAWLGSRSRIKNSWLVHGGSSSDCLATCNPMPALVHDQLHATFPLDLHQTDCTRMNQTAECHTLAYDLPS